MEDATAGPPATPRLVAWAHDLPCGRSAIYLVAAVLLLFVKAVQLGTGH